jgi:hypothetical protein
MLLLVAPADEAIGRVGSGAGQKFIKRFNGNAMMASGSFYRADRPARIQCFSTG